jgi:hypothetical protein
MYLRENASPEELLKREAPREWKCSRQGCGKSFLHQRYLRRHERFGHIDGLDSESSWEPRTCDQGCTASYLYTTEARYKDHISTMHPRSSSFLPQQCALKDVCGLEKEFAYAKLYKSHLSLLHKLDAKQIQAYMPAKAKVAIPYKKAPCPLGNCNFSEKNIPDRHHLVRHLTGLNHGLSKYAARSIAGWPVGEDDNNDQEEEDDTTLQPVQPQLPVKFPCPLGKCKSTRQGLKTCSGLKKHLLSKEHKCSEEEAIKLSGVKPRKGKNSAGKNKEQSV